MDGKGLLDGIRRLSCAAVLLTAACAVETTQGTVHRRGVPQSFAYAAGGRDLTVVVVGNPFGLPKDAVDRAVTDAMQGRNFGPNTHFTTRPSDDARRQFRIVLMFDPPASLDPRALCGEPAALKPERPGARVQVSAAFCAGADVLSDVRATAPAATSPGDASFHRTIGGVIRELIPSEDPFVDLD